jgi:hypothetical protein
MDNISMVQTRRIIAGIIMHHQFIAGRSIWDSKMHTAWAAKVDKTISVMKTLKKGSQFGITHAGIPTWEPPSFAASTTHMAAGHNSSSRDDMATMHLLRDEIRTKKLTLAQLKKSKKGTIHDLLSDEEDDPDDESYTDDSVGSGMQVTSNTPNEYSQAFIKDLLAEQETRIVDRFSQMLAQAQHSKHYEKSSVSDEGSSQTGGSHLPTFYDK